MANLGKTLAKIVACSVLLPATARHASACLRAAPDARAIQWATVIVEAKLMAVDAPVEIVRVKQSEVGKSPLAHSYWYQLHTFDVTDVLDGRGARRAQDVKVVRFFGRIDRIDRDALPCSQHLRKEQVGRSFILLLRPERELRVEVAPTDPAVNDIRNEAVHKLGAYAIINLVPREEMDADEKAALKRLVGEVRAVERAFSAQKARRLAEHVASTAETPESETEATELLAMGPRAIPDMTRAWNTLRGPRSGRDRLQTLIAELTPPPIPVAVEGPMAVERDGQRPPSN
jgi:hypothetical protein